MARKLLALRVLAIAGAETLSSYNNGQEFTKCISIKDFESKTLDDDITLIDRVDSCCPAESTAGVNKGPQGEYKGAQVLCGFKPDGSVSVSSSTSGGTKTCNYNTCYVDKQNLDCTGGKKQFLNGCCPDTTQANEGFPAHCKNYYNSVSTVNAVSNDKIKYCKTYHKDYSKMGYSGTKDKTDDQSGGMLIPSKVYTYAPCSATSKVIVLDPRHDWKVKNKATLVCLMWFLGSCGCDRCYMGTVGLGVAKGLTAGGCGIWSIIDMIVILGNGFGKDKYIDTMSFKAVFEKDTIDGAWTASLIMVLICPVCCLCQCCLVAMKKNQH